MRPRFLPILILGSLAAQADVLTPTERFFGMGGQYPDYSEEGQEVLGTALDQAPYSPADSDLGVQEILVERSDRSPVVFDLNTAILRTDNAPGRGGLTSEGSWLSSTRMAAAWRPHLACGWFGDLGINQDVLRFEASNATDYENFGARIGTFRILPDLDDTIVFARYEYQRITSGSLRDGDYNAQRLRAGLQKVLWAAPRHQLASNLSGSYEWTATPELLQRNHFSLDFAYRYSITDSVYTTATARASYFDYANFGREDFAYGLGLELIWEITRNFKASASVFYDNNDSNSAFAANDYEAWSGGLGLGLQWAF